MTRPCGRVIARNPKGGAAIQSRSPMTPPNEVTVGLKPRYAQNVGS
jgi:hypothetical protein